MKRKVKWILGIVIVLGILGYGIYAILQPLPVEVIQVEPTTIKDTFTEEGTVTPKEETTLSSTQTGKVTQLFVEEGEMVTKDQPILELDTAQLQHQLDTLKAQKKNAESLKEKSFEELSNEIKQQKIRIAGLIEQIDLADREYDRYAALYEEGAISLSELEKIKADGAVLKNTLGQERETLVYLEEQYSTKSNGSPTESYYRSSIETVEAQINELNYAIEQSTILAPADGVIRNLTVKIGTMVSPAAPICTVFQSHPFWVETYVLSEDALNLKKGMKVQLILDGRNENLYTDGSIDFITPYAEERISALGLIEQRVKIKILPEKDFSTPLYPGYSLDVEFTTNQEEGVLSLPKSTLFPWENGDAIWVVENDTAQIRPVTTGLETDLDAVITEGLQEGDQVIKNPQTQGLKEGKKVAGK